MKNSIGNNLVLTLFGESHGEYIGAVLDGLAPGIEINEEYIKESLARRRPSSDLSTSRVEEDEYKIVSGVLSGVTTGAPLCFLIANKAQRSEDYEQMKNTPRPSHADFGAEVKYRGFADKRGGGHFSGRLTAAIVFAGAIVSYALEKKGIYIGSHVKAVRCVRDRDFGDVASDLSLLEGRSFPTLCTDAEEEMKRVISEARQRLDSVGGIIETAIIGTPAGVGEPWFDTAEGALAKALYSIPAIKGVEFGAGFGFSELYGSEANDPYIIKDGQVLCSSNNNGGVCGGITNGMPIIFRCAVKPTPSIGAPQATVDLSTMKETTVTVGGRHDPAIISRICPVADAVSALVIADLLICRFGTDYLA